MTDVPVDNAARGAAPEGLTLAEEEELRAELAKVRGARLGSLCLASALLGRNKQEPQGQDWVFCCWGLLCFFLFLILQCYLWVSEVIVEMHKAGRYFKRCGVLFALSQNSLI